MLAVVAPGVVTARADVVWRDDRVTATFNATPLGDAMQALATATGGELRGGVASPRDVTLRLERVPLEEALHRLLGTQNFTVRYAQDGRVKAIALEGAQEAPRPSLESGSGPRWSDFPQTPN